MPKKWQYVGNNKISLSWFQVSQGPSSASSSEKYLHHQKNPLRGCSNCWWPLPCWHDCCWGPLHPLHLSQNCSAWSWIVSQASFGDTCPVPLSLFATFSGSVKLNLNKLNHCGHKLQLLSDHFIKLLNFF
jgi:hypothetical protein